MNECNCLSWWYPQIKDLVPTPLTFFKRFSDLTGLLDRTRASRKVARRVAEWIIDRSLDVGWPLFLRTGLFSGKHRWKDTCFVDRPEVVRRHIYKLVEDSYLADALGLATDVWVVRKLIPAPEDGFTAFDGLPIRRELRCFIRDGRLICIHPYWPEDAIKQHTSAPKWRELLMAQNHSTQKLDDLPGLSETIGRKIPGYWSVDWMWDQEECHWLLIDMAEGDVSWHWPDCPGALRS